MSHNADCGLLVVCVRYRTARDCRLFAVCAGSEWLTANDCGLLGVCVGPWDVQPAVGETQLVKEMVRLPRNQVRS